MAKRCAAASPLGAKAEAQTQAGSRSRRRRTLAPAPTPLAVVLVDGFQVRFRGPGWGQRKTDLPCGEWHEAKLGVFYRHEQAVRKARGQLVEKVVVSWQGEGLELGRRRHWKALRGGLARAQAVLALGDGAPWTWNVVHDRWRHAHRLLDFYHASQHLWTLE